MTVKELIEKLQEFDGDLELLCPEAYEPGLIPIIGVWLYENKQHPLYCGKVVIAGDE